MHSYYPCASVINCPRRRTSAGSDFRRDCSVSPGTNEPTRVVVINRRRKECERREKFLPVDLRRLIVIAATVGQTGTVGRRSR